MRSLALGLIGVARGIGGVHRSNAHTRLAAYGLAVAFLVFGVAATRSAASEVSRVTRAGTPRGDRCPGCHLARRLSGRGARSVCRAGALDATMEGTVTSVGLLYTTLETAEGVLNIPNSGLLAAAVGPIPPPQPKDRPA